MSNFLYKTYKKKEKKKNDVAHRTEFWGQWRRFIDRRNLAVKRFRGFQLKFRTLPNKQKEPGKIFPAPGFDYPCGCNEDYRCESSRSGSY